MLKRKPFMAYPLPGREPADVAKPAPPARFNSGGDANSGGTALLFLKTHTDGMSRDWTRQPDEWHGVRSYAGSEEMTHREQILDF